MRTPARRLQERRLRIESLENRLFLDGHALLTDFAWLDGSQLETEAEVSTDTSGEIHGSVYHDVNGSGLRDGDEPGLAGCTMYLDENGNGQFDTAERTSVTDDAGNYHFTGLAPGTWQVAQVTPTDWLPTFQRKPEVVATKGNEAVALVPANLDPAKGDTDTDLAVMVPNSNAVVLLANDGSGTFARTSNTLFVGRNPCGIAAVDLDGTNGDDFVTANQLSGTISVRLNDGKGAFRVPALPSLPIGTNPRDVVGFHYDGDADWDLAVVSGADGKVTVLRNDGLDAVGNPQFTPIAIPKPLGPAYPNDVLAGDFNGDGQEDLAAVYLQSEEVVAYWNSSTGFVADGQVKRSAVFKE
jgi:hypothetical protein